MSRLPLNTLVAFRAVAESQNLRAAAEQLHLTHSAVSQQIRALEERLGFALFDRHGRRVVLNRAGEALLRAVQGALVRLDEGDPAGRNAHLPAPLQHEVVPRAPLLGALHHDGMAVGECHELRRLDPVRGRQHRPQSN